MCSGAPYNTRGPSSSSSSAEGEGALPRAPAGGLKDAAGSHQESLQKLISIDPLAAIRKSRSHSLDSGAPLLPPPFPAIGSAHDPLAASAATDPAARRMQGIHLYHSRTRVKNE